MAVEITIRWAKMSDLDSLVATAQKVLEGLEKIGRANWYGGNDKKEFKEVLLSRKNEDGCVVAVNNGNIIGFIVLNTHNEEMCKKHFRDYQIGTGLCIDGMGVLPQYQRQKVFTKMFAFAKSYAKALEKDYFFGTVAPENHVSQKVLRENTELFMISKKAERHEMFDNRILERKYFLAKI